MNVEPKMRPNNFDLIRLLAALQVVCLHGIHHLELDSFFANNWFVTILRYFPGVPIFFFMSGFMVSASYERNSDIRTYAANRLLRIYPGLWCCFFISLISVAIFGDGALFFAKENLVPFLAWCVAQISFFQFYNPDFLRPYGVGVLNGSLWTIPIELQFYVALPVMYAACRIKKVKDNSLGIGLIATFTIFLIVSQVFFSFRDTHSEELWFKLINCSMVPHYWLFVLGVMFQRVFARIRWLFDGKFHVWLVVHLGVVLIANALHLPAASNIPHPIVGISLACTAMAAAFTLKTASDKILKGQDLSYGVYIYHMIIVNAMVSCGMIGQNWHLVFLFLTTIAIAGLSWRIIEVPAIKLKKHLLKK